MAVCLSAHPAPRCAMAHGAGVLALALNRLGIPGSLPQTVLAGQHDRLGTFVRPDLVEDVSDMVAHGLLGQFQMGGDLRIVEALRNALQYLNLARSELRECARNPSRRPRRIELRSRSQQFAPSRLVLH